MTKTEKLKKVMTQPSAIRGFIALLSLAGMTLSPENMNQILAAGGFLLSLYEIFRDEDK